MAAQKGGLGRHPDIVRIADLPIEDIVDTPVVAWKSSYSVGDKCYCDSNFPDNAGNAMVTTSRGTMTIRAACALVGTGPGAAGRPIYNDIQCGNGPASDTVNERYCPGRVDAGKDGCAHIGPTWQFPADNYTEQNGLVVMEAENTASDLDLWKSSTSVSGFTGSGYLEFGGALLRFREVV